MRAFLFVLALGLCGPPRLPAQASQRTTFARTSLAAAVSGHWVGTLEYRDYTEPPASTKRVQLPTWLSVRQGRDGLAFDYTYDDGPGKTVADHVILDIDPEARTYKVLTAEGPPELYTVQGFEALHNGYGTLTLNSTITENHQPAEVRVTWTIRPNLLSWLEEVRPANSAEPFAFRHRYTFTRITAPPVARMSTAPEK